VTHPLRVGNDQFPICSRSNRTGLRLHRQCHEALELLGIFFVGLHLSQLACMERVAAAARAPC
jgi:hypothetical protein